MNTEQKRLTHKQLCELGARWIANEPTSEGAWKIYIEVPFRSESPDVFAFNYKNSVVIECKASRADFLKDKDKPFRKEPQLGVGRRRFYLVNKGVCTQDEMPKGWQLLIAYNENTILLPTNFDLPTNETSTYNFDCRNATEEIAIMGYWESRKATNTLPQIPTERVNLIHDYYWRQEGFDFGKLSKITRKF